VTALDQAGNRLPFLRDTLVIAVAGPVSLAGGEAFQPLRGGCAGFWLRAGDRPGVASATVSAGRFRPVTLETRRLSPRPSVSRSLFDDPGRVF
jgi:beta-galactosidase